MDKLPEGTPRVKPKDLQWRPPRPPLVSVHRTKKPCPVCGKRDNCAVSDDGTYCRRVWSEHRGRDGGFWHPNEEGKPVRQPVLHVVKPEPKETRAARHTRHTIYEVLLRLSPLLPEHRENLSARGLSPEAIARGLFKSTPTEAETEQIASEISRDCEPSGVPGFFYERGRWQLVKVPSGFFVPVRDRAGLIQGLQVRRDYLRHAKDPRYTWLSSRGYPLGTSSGAPAGIEYPERIIETGRALITEGSLKAYVAAQYLPPDEGGIIALAGVSTFRDTFALHLKQAFPSLHSVSIAFDRDWREKREVKRQLYRLMRLLKAESLSVSVCTWDTTEKGIDDYLVAEAREKEARVA